MEDYLEINYETNMKNLTEAIACCEASYEHSDLINELSLDNDIKKQLCIIELKKIDSQDEANILIENLTGKSGPVREAASFKILEFISTEQYKNYFQTKEIINTITKGITDINPAVSRNMVEVVRFIDDFEYLKNKIIEEITITLNSMDDIKQNRSYTSNKKNFNLYWNLEALTNIADKISITEGIVEIINTTYKSNDYTIREKTAKLICYINKKYIEESIIEALKNDENIYVNKYFR